MKQKFNLQAQTNLIDWFRYGITFLFTKASGCGKCRFAKAKKIEKPQLLILHHVPKISIFLQ